MRTKASRPPQRAFSHQQKSSSKKAKQPGAHRAHFPDVFCQFMLQGWQKKKAGTVKRVDGHAYFHERRKKLSRCFLGDVLIVPTGHEKVRSNDSPYPFRCGSDFYYLTGNMEPDCVLLFWPTDTGHTPIMFVEPNPGRGDTTFFTDAAKGELWVGPRLGLNESTKRFGIACRSLADWPKVMAYIRQHTLNVRCLRGLSRGIDTLLPKSLIQVKRDKAVSQKLSEMRLIKDTFEIKAIKKACDATRRGFDDIIACLPTATSERDVECAFHRRARLEGRGPGYGSIAASGSHACTLHWTHNDGALNRKDLLLVDAGIEGESIYTADITRTLPISGRFDKVQAKVYDLVLEAHAAALAAIKPGNDFLAPNRAATVVFAHGLVKLGVLKDAEEALVPEHQFYRRYTLHNVSHMLGLDVHDCSHARPEHYRNGPLKPGMVLTVEPGLYFQPDDLTVPKKLRGIGIRVEDNVVVTKTSYHVLTCLPRRRLDVQRWMSEIMRPLKKDTRRR